MKRELIELFINQITELTYKKIKKFLGVSKKHMDEEVKNTLKELELDGILYEDKDGLYKSVPSNFFVSEINETKKGTKYIIVNEDRIYLQKENLNGALPYDKVLIENNGENYNVKKVILRNMPYIVCEVIIKNGKKYLKPINTENDLEIIISTNAMKKLVVGERILVKVLTSIYDDKYDAEVIKSIGHKDDPDIDFKTVAYSNGFDFEFSKEALKELESIPDEVTEEDLIGRVDLRKWNTFTIDGEDTKDMDDAISIKKLEDGYLLGVHIAHVSHYIKPKSALFEEALKRSTSVYFPEAVIPMFPHKISNGICSLNENVDRLTRTVLMKFDTTGNLKDYKIFKSVIHSNKKMTYENVDKLLNGENVEGYEEYKQDIKLMKALSDKLSYIKNERGYIGFDNEELKFKLDNIGNTEELKVKNRLKSEELIENFMLVPNHLVTLHIGARPCVYRNHPFPSDYRIKETFIFLLNLGYRIKNLSNLDSRLLVQKLLEIFKDKEEFLILSNMILRSMRLAYYGIENEGHYGLALEDGYTHYTSPIRRMPDLLVHTLLDMYDQKELTEEEATNLLNFLETACKHASKMERLSEKAEYEVEKVQVVNYVKQHIGETTEVYIEQINEDHLVVRSKELMDGIIYFEDLNDDVFMLPSGKLKSNITGRVYKIGHKLEVEILNASYTDKLIYYKMIDNLTLSEADEKKLLKIRDC